MSRIKSRIFAFILTFCMVFTGLVTQDMGKVLAAGEGSGMLTDCVIKIGGQELTQDTVVSNGDTLDIQFNWKLDNNDQTSSEFVVDMGELKGIQIATDAGQYPLKQGSEEVGTYYIVDNKLHISLYKDNKFFDENERTGGVRVEGIVQVNEGDIDADNGTTVGVGTYTYTVQYKETKPPYPTWVEVSKGLSGGLTTDSDGGMQQTFTVTMVARNDDATNVTIKDTPGSGMTLPEDVQIAVTGGGLDGTYTGMDGLNTALAGKALPKDEVVTLTYTMPVNETIYQAGAGASVKGNSVRVDYTTNEGNPAYAFSAAEIKVTDAPGIEKTGQMSADQKTATWTITVDLGKYYVPGSSLADLLAYVQDTPGAGFTNAGIPTDLDLNQFSDHQDGTFTYEYTTTVTDAYLNSGSNAILKNDVTMKLKNNPGYEYADVGTVDLTGTSWVTKTARENKDENGYIVWDVTLDIPAGVQDIVVYDTLGNKNDQAFVDGIYVDGVKVRTTSGKIYDNKGTYTAGAVGVLVDSYGNPVADGQEYWDIDIRLANKYIEGKSQVVITYKTLVTNDAVKEFYNSVRVGYKCPAIGTTSHTADATFKDNTSSLLLSKDAVAGSDGYSVDYKIKLDLSKYLNRKAGDTITFVDILPEGMLWNGTEASVKCGFLGAEWNAIANVVSKETLSDGRQKLTFVLTLNDENVSVLQSSGVPGVSVALKAELTDAEKQNLFEANKKTYTNDASVTYGNLSATAKAPITLQAPSVVDKNGAYDENTAPDCNYVIEINKECLDLVEGDTLMGVDTLGELVTYRKNTVKVEKNTASGWITLNQGSDYYFTYSEEGGNKNLIFNGLPDATHLKISYTARLELKEGTFKDGEAGNAFTLQGSKNGLACTDYTATTTAVQSSGWATSKYYDITLNKYWTDGSGQMKPLNGAEFKVVKMKINETTGLLEEDYVLHDNIKVEAEGEVTIGLLTLQHIYALYETIAPNGYERKTEPYYFMVRNSLSPTITEDISKLDSSVKIHYFAEDSTIWYENKPASGSLEIQKTVTGIDAADLDADKISFTITPRVGTKDTYKLSEFTKGTNGVYSLTFSNVPVGEYTVAESREAFTGYTFKQMDYAVEINGGAVLTGSEVAGDTGKTVDVKVEKDTTTYVKVENTYEKQLTQVTVTKKWMNMGVNPVYPTQITVHLLANGVEKEVRNLTAADGWTCTFDNLPEYDSNGKIVYTITETALEDYSTTINGYEITNTYNPGKTSVSVTKTWDDNNNQDGIRSSSVEVQLYADGVAMGQPVTLQEGSQWSYTWNDLDARTSGGKKIVYTVQELTQVAGYTSAISGSAEAGFFITNVHTPETVNIAGQKTWNDNNNQDGKRPAEITIRLFADGVEADNKKVTAAENWSWDFGSLPKCKNGTAIVYTIREDKIPGYTTTITGFDVTNTYVPEEISVTVNKQWDDANNQDGKRPDSVQVQLYKKEAAGDVAVGNVVYLSSANLWKNTWNNLPKYQDGSEIEYVVKEVSAVAEYTTTITGSMADGFTITNVHVPETITVSGSKTWSDANNQDGKRPDSIVVSLLVDGTKVDSQTVTAANNWKWTFTDVPKYANGKLIQYTIAEDAVADYTPKVNGYNITNSYTPGKTSVTVNKEWQDANNQDGIRPGSIQVQLYADGIASGNPVTLEDSNQWTYTWMDLDLMKAGKAIVYTVDEIGVPADYSKTITGDAVAGFTMINSYTPAVTEIAVEKIWQDGNNQDGKRPESILVQLYADNNPYGTAVTLNAANDWKYEWTGLPKMSAGTEIVYTVDELVVPGGYTKTVSAMTQGKVNITNQYTPEGITIEGSKTWVDENDKYAKRPGSIKIRLYKNNTQISVKEVTAADNWAWKFTQLPKYENGVEIVYTIKEDAVADYSTVINGYDVTNTYNVSVEPGTPGQPTTPGTPSEPTTPGTPSQPTNPTPAPITPSVPSTPVFTPAPTPITGGSSGQVATPNLDTVPKTADEAPIVLWIGMMILGFAGMMTVGSCMWKRKNKRK